METSIVHAICSTLANTKIGLAVANAKEKCKGKISSREIQDSLLVGNLVRGLDVLSDVWMKLDVGHFCPHGQCCDFFSVKT